MPCDKMSAKEGIINMYFGMLLIPFFIEKVLSQWLHVQCFSPVCSIICLPKAVLFENLSLLKLLAECYQHDFTITKTFYTGYKHMATSLYVITNGA